MTARFHDAEVVQATGAQQVRTGASSTFVDVCTDSRQLTPGCLFVALKGERFDAHSFLGDVVKGGAAGIVVQRGAALPDFGSASPAVFAVEDTLVALGRLARHHRARFRMPVVAVTGSNGKTTTKELVGSILATRGPALKTQGNLNNEIGVPLTLFGLEPSHVAAVIEMGMNHAGEISRLAEMAQPDAGLITIVQPAHLEGLGSIEGVASAKGELFRGLGSHATAVVNLDDARVAGQARGLAAKSLTFGRSAEAQVRLESTVERGAEGQTLRIRFDGRTHEVRLSLVGAHNALNATGAFALALAVGYSPESCVAGLESAKAHSRRLQILPAPGGVTVIDDCYNANPASMAAALQTLQSLAVKGRGLAVLGDMLELGSEEKAAHLQLGELAGAGPRMVAFFGPRSRAGYEQAVKTLGDRTQHFEAIAPLVDWLKPQLQPHDFVLVKGSRGMRLERVVEALTGAAPSGGH